MATNKQIRISITSALNAAGIEATKAQIATMSRSVSQAMQDASKSTRTHWADIKAAWDLGTAAIRKACGALSTILSSAFHFETQTNQFKTLIGNIDDAKAHMADLKALGDTPPFNLDQFAKASRSLMVMTDGALGYKKSLELIGDAAAATGHPIEEMGQAVGRLYAFIRDGQPLSRAVMQLRNMGVITPEVAQKLQDLQAAGKSNAEIWAEVEAQLGRYKGAMKETESTGEGLMGAIKSRWNNIVRAIGHAFEDTAKDGMGEVLTAMDDLEESGAIESWASATVSALNTVAEKAQTVASWFGKIWDHLKAGREAWKEMDQEAAEASGEAESFEFLREERVNPYTLKKYYKGSQGSERVEVVEDMAEKKKYEKRQREEERLAKEARREAEESARIKASLEEGQKKKDERDAKAAAEKKAEADKKAAEKAAAERAKLDAQEAVRRERERQAELTAKIKDHQKLLAAERAEESKTRSAVSAAESKLQQAWGWYRDKDSMAAQLQEEKADAEARKQFEKDFAKLKDRRRDWRKAENLSVDDEAVRRVALAREEKEAAEKHLAEIEKNTADLAEKLDELLQVKG